MPRLLDSTACPVPDPLPSPQNQDQPGINGKKTPIASLPTANGSHSHAISRSLPPNRQGRIFRTNKNQGQAHK